MMGDYGEGHTVESMDLISMEGKGTKKIKNKQEERKESFPKAVSGRATTKQMSFEDLGVKRSVL